MTHNQFVLRISLVMACLFVPLALAWIIGPDPATGKMGEWLSQVLMLTAIILAWFWGFTIAWDIKTGLQEYKPGVSAATCEEAGK